MKWKAIVWNNRYVKKTVIYGCGMKKLKQDRWKKSTNEYKVAYSETHKKNSIEVLAILKTNAL